MASDIDTLFQRLLPLIPQTSMADYTVLKEHLEAREYHLAIALAVALITKHKYKPAKQNEVINVVDGLIARTNMRDPRYLPHTAKDLEPWDAWKQTES